MNTITRFRSGLIVESENDRAEWEGGEKRYQLRKQRRREGF